MTNDTNWTPQPGDTVYAKLYVDRHDGDREGNRPWRCLDASNYPRAFNTADLAPYPPQREPWTVLREAACVVEARRGSALADMMRREADTMQHEANPRTRLAALAQTAPEDAVRRAVQIIEEGEK